MLNATKADPPVSAFAITPSDSVDLDQPTRGLWVGGFGNVRVLFANDSTPVTLVGVQGQISGVIKRVYATSTTATSIIGFV